MGNTRNHVNKQMDQSINKISASKKQSSEAWLAGPNAGSTSVRGSQQLTEKSL